MGKKKIIFFIILIGLMTVILIGCQPVKKAKVSLASKGIFPITIKDDSDKAVLISKKPYKIISMAPSNTEILFALGLADKVIAVDDFSDYPKAALKKDKIGGFSKPNIEKITGLGPDLVLASGTEQLAAVQELRRLGVTVFYVDSKKMSDVIEAIKNVGKITGADEQGEKLTQKMKDKISDITAKTAKLKESKRIKVFYELYHEPLMSAGQGTFIDDMIKQAGGNSISGSSNESYPEFSLEFLLKEDPQVYLAASGSMTDPGEINKRPGWESLTAVKNKKVFIVDENLVNRPGPRIVDGFAEIAKAIYPELF